MVKDFLSDHAEARYMPDEIGRKHDRARPITVEADGFVDDRVVRTLGTRTKLEANRPPYAGRARRIPAMVGLDTCPAGGGHGRPQHG